MRKLGSAYRAMAIIVTNTLVLLVLVNVVLWGGFAIVGARHKVQSLPPFAFYRDLLSTTYPEYSAAQVVQLLAETWSRPLMCEPFTHFREAPYRGRFVNVHPAGFRMVEDQGPWPPDPLAYNIFVFGGSTTFGYNVADAETIPSYLQRALRQSGWNVRVYNFGQAYYFSSLELALFEKLLRDGVVPNAAIFIDGLNEFFHWNGVPIGMEICGQADPGAKRLGFELPMMRLVNVLSRPVAGAAEPATRSTSDPAPDDPAVTGEILDRWFTNKLMTEAVARTYGVEATFVWQPVPTYEYDLAYHPYVQNNPESFAKHLRSRYGYEAMSHRSRDAQRFGDVVYLADMQQDRHERLYVDMVHYLPGFASSIAAALADRLLHDRNAPGVDARTAGLR